MARSRSRRKRVKDESDLDETGCPSTPDGAPAKRRRTIAETSSVPPTSSPNIHVVTKRVTRQDSASTILTPTARTTGGQQRVVVEGEPDDFPLDIKPKVEEDFPALLERESIPLPDSSTSTLSNVSLASETDLRPIKTEMPEATIDSSDKENVYLQAQRATTSKLYDAKSAKSQVKSVLRDIKGKGRAISPSQEHDTAETTSRKIDELQAELASLKRELHVAHTSAADQQAFKNKVTESITCNICLEALKHPVVLLCGHAFCQNDLWNWFHRKPDEGETDSYSSSESNDGSDGVNDEGNDADSGSDQSATSGILRNRQTAPSRQMDERVARRLRDPEDADILPVDNDYDTDQSLDSGEGGSDSTGLSRSTSPVAVRGGIRLQTTRGEQVARQHHALPNANAAYTGLVEEQGAEPAAATNEEGIGGAVAAMDESRPARVPALSRPQRRNLVCPQCRSGISLPPFPVFILQSLADLVGHDIEDAQRGTSPADDHDSIIRDPTWGGLFPRMASFLGRAPAHDTAGRENNRSRSDSESASQGSRSLADINDAAGPSRIPGYHNGLHQRQETEYDNLVIQRRAARLRQLERDRDARRRTARATRTLTAEEANLQAEEDHAVEEARRLLLQSRAERHSRATAGSRGRDILRHGIRDAEDGVRRCIDCHWEIEDGRCQHCGIAYDSDSEYDDRGDDLNEDGPTSQTREGSDVASTESDTDGPSEGRDAVTGGNDDEDRASDLGDAQRAQRRRRGLVADTRQRQGRGRKRSQYLYDSEDGEDVADEEESEADDFLVSDSAIIVRAQDEDAILDDSSEAESTDRESRRRRKEERRQARAARAITRHDGSLSDVTNSDTDSATDDSTDYSDSDESDAGSGASPSGRPAAGVDDDDDTPVIASQEVRRSLQGERSVRVGSARDHAAQAAIKRNARPAAVASEADMQALFRDRVVRAGGEEILRTADSSVPAPGPSIRRKRIIAASDEE